MWLLELSLGLNYEGRGYSAWEVYKGWLCCKGLSMDFLMFFSVNTWGILVFLVGIVYGILGFGALTEGTILVIFFC